MTRIEACRGRWPKVLRIKPGGGATVEVRAATAVMTVDGTRTVVIGDVKDVGTRTLLLPAEFGSLRPGDVVWIGRSGMYLYGDISNTPSERGYLLEQRSVGVE